MADGGRLTAQHARIVDVVAGNILKDESAPRVNLVGVVVSVQNESPPSFMIDDRSALVLVRQFDNNIPPSIGNVVCVIGRMRNQSGECYIACEIVKPVESKWLEVRSLELAKKSSFSTPKVDAPVEETVSDDVTDSDSQVLGVIRKLDDGSGAAVDDILTDAGADAEKVISLLLQRGDIFEVSPGRIKILE